MNVPHSKASPFFGTVSSPEDVSLNVGVNPGRTYPSKQDLRFSEGIFNPHLSRKFTFGTPCKIFTIGSCFARNIEEALSDAGVDLPTLRFSVPKTEWPFRSNGLLNEYNPGTMSQRILSALYNIPSPEDTLIAREGMFIDLLLAGRIPVSYERAIERRREIDEVYRELKISDVIIITLGFIEAWYDKANEIFLNNKPPSSTIESQPQRFEFRRLSVFDAYSLLEKAMVAMINAGIKKIILTVSPVPLTMTYTSSDAVIANTYSKSVLRVCAEMLSEQFAQIDYFPSYEIVNGCGPAAFIEDNVHVTDDLVRAITKKMLRSYLV